MWSARRRMSRLSGVTSPRMRMARPGPGKRVPAHHLLRQAQLAAHLPHFVLEELAQRLQQLERQPLGQAAHVVVGLDRDRRPALRRERLDDVGIERALHQEAHVRRRPTVASASNTSMKVWPMRRRFSSGSVTPASRSRKRSLGVHHPEIDAQVAAEGRSRPAPARAGAAGRDPRRCR